MSDNESRRGPFCEALARSIDRAETVSTAGNFDDIAATCQQVCEDLSHEIARELGVSLPQLAAAPVAEAVHDSQLAGQR